MFLIEKEKGILTIYGWFDLLLFLFFFTAHADQLHLTLFGLSFRLHNLISLLLGLLSIASLKIIHIDRQPAKQGILIVGVFVLSAVLGCAPARSLLFVGWLCWTIVFSLFLPLFLFRHYNEKKVLTLYFLSFLCVGLYAASQLLFSCFSLHDPFVDQCIGAKLARPNAFAYEPSYYALYMTPFVMMATLYSLLKRKGLILVMAVHLLYLLSTSTSCLFAYMIFFVVALFVKEVRQALFKYTLGMVSAMVFLALLLPSLFKEFFLKFFVYGTTHHSFFERWVGIVNAWKIFLQNPVFGVGLGGIPVYLYEAWNQNDPRFLYLPTQSEVMASSTPLKFFEPSNHLTELLASVGLVGILAVGFLLFTLAKRFKKGLTTSVGEERETLVVFLVSSVVMLVVMQFNQGLFRSYTWIQMALTYGVLKK